MSTDLQTIASITFTTGDFRGKNGNSSIYVFVNNEESGWATAVDFQRAIKNASDRTVRIIPSSTHGAARGGILGQWKTRTVELPTNTFFYAKVAFRGKGKMETASVIMPFVADPRAALQEYFFPSLNEDSAALATVELTGRFRPPTIEEFNAEFSAIRDKTASNLIMNECAETYPDYVEHLQDVYKSARKVAHSDSQLVDVFTIPFPETDRNIRVRVISGAVIAEGSKLTRKKVVTKRDRTVTIASRKRRIKI